MGSCDSRLGLTIAAFDRKTRTNGRAIAITAAFMALISLWLAVREVTFYDTALYHQQSVKWLSTYGLVRGIGLICFRFALVSSWFAAAGPLNHGVLAGRAPAIVGGLPIVLMIVPALLLFLGLMKTRTAPLRSVTWIFFCSALALVSLAENVGNSLSPDMMAWLAPGIVLLVLTDSEVPESARVGQALVIAALGFLAKVSVAPALAWCGVLAVGYMFRQRNGRGRLFACILASAALVALFLCANTIASGCPVFPSPFGCVSSAWSVGREYAIRNLAAVEGYNRSGRYDRQMYALLALSLSSVAVIARFRHFDSVIRHGLAISSFGIVFVFAFAPVPRYGMGYFLLPVAIACGVVAERVRNWIVQRSAAGTTASSDSGRSGAYVFRILILAAAGGFLACLLMPVLSSPFVARRDGELQWRPDPYQ